MGLNEENELEKVYIGGEAIVKIYRDRVEKIRKKKKYRIDELDEAIRKYRTKHEAKILSIARKAGVPTPIVLDVREDTIIMEKIEGTPLKDIINKSLSRKVGELVAKLHDANIIHGDITPLNLILKDNKIYFVDFGLSFIEDRIEPKGVDIHVYFESLKASFDNWKELKEAFIDGYKKYKKWKEVLERVKEIEGRGRYIERKEKKSFNVSSL